MCSDGIVHVYPLRDLRDHDPSGETECWCKPTYNHEDRIVVHNALDGREDYETQKKRHH